MHTNFVVGGFSVTSAHGLILIAIVLGLFFPYALAEDLSLERSWIMTMKEAPRGPFAQVRWFCRDGSILPPTPNACLERGGGAQHGQWTDQVENLRSQGFRIANLLADTDGDAFLAQPDPIDVFAQVTIEQFLMAVDNGWILRQARFYRGALQEEAERGGARRILFKMAESREWLETRLLMLRTGAKLISHGPDTDLVTRMRQSSTDLASQDPGFNSLRNKIHARPEIGDSQAVLAYARDNAPSDLAPGYEALASIVRDAFHEAAGSVYLRELAPKMRRWGDLEEVLNRSADELDHAAGAAERFRITARILGEIRARLMVPNGPSTRMALVAASQKIESDHFIAGAHLREALPTMSRREIIDLITYSITALYGTGILSRRQVDALKTELEPLHLAVTPLATYKSAVDYLARVTGWGTSAYALYYSDAMQKLAGIEPLANLFIQDQLRGSAMFFFAEALDLLQVDTIRLTGMRVDLFGKATGAMRALNAGLAEGPLRSGFGGSETPRFERTGIYFLPETVADLPPIGGIITVGEGNPLSHVQLLARNLGIPNVAIDDRLVDTLNKHIGKQVRLAASPGGAVVIEEIMDSPVAPANSGVRIAADLEKLNLSYRQFTGLDRLTAEDSGRFVGPKAAKLGELRRHYPDAVAPGIVIPFGEFRVLLDQPKAGTDSTVFDWIVQNYRRLDQVSHPKHKADQTEAFRVELEKWVSSADPGPEFRRRLTAAMEETFGADGSYGVFVRSDTNIEDLPGFTGAGLNLTVPNVVGMGAVLAAVSRVWASPFSARAFAWRQALMASPEHVYPAILLQKTVPAQKSGVLVTREIDTGADGWLSVAVNEGKGGAVDGQAAESLRIDLQSGRVRMLAQASAPWRRVPAPAGGITKVRTSGASTVLTAPEIARLIEFAEALPQQFPPIIDDEGQVVPADVEFGFLDGKLVLFQIRPFLENARAQRSEYLVALDQTGKANRSLQVDLDGVVQR